MKEGKGLTEVELDNRELSIIINSLQSQESLGSEETTLLKKLSDIYKEEIEPSPPPE